ncbi:protein kinase domain-containing protein [Haliangium sp.]|uniref:protein kinase domain-containing protein n=1 Tax=Haliangium sp. TaxID=2663208 RepID=UPI003D0D5D8D
MGRYHLAEPLGGGPTGEVFRAKVYGVAGFEREFAVKRFHPGFVNNPEVANVLAAAARSYGSLEHPRIARLHEYGVASGETFTATELVQGVDTARLVSMLPTSGNTLPPGAAVALVSQAARAVGYAHGRGICHLGLCPTNIISTPDGDVKITDFCFLPARLPSRPGDDPTLRARMPYLAPEQLVGEPASAPTDVYQLGVVAYEVMTGRSPFTGASSSEIAQRIMQAQPPTPAIAAPLAEVLKRCLTRSPFERYPDARALADALDAAARTAQLDGDHRDLAVVVRALLSQMAEVSDGQSSGAVSFPLPSPPRPASAVPGQKRTISGVSPQQGVGAASASGGPGPQMESMPLEDSAASTLELGYLDELPTTTRGRDSGFVSVPGAAAPESGPGTPDAGAPGRGHDFPDAGAQPSSRTLFGPAPSRPAAPASGGPGAGDGLEVVPLSEPLGATLAPGAVAPPPLPPTRAPRPGSHPPARPPAMPPGVPPRRPGAPGGPGPAGGPGMPPGSAGGPGTLPLSPPQRSEERPGAPLGPPVGEPGGSSPVADAMPLPSPPKSAIMPAALGIPELDGIAGQGGIGEEAVGTEIHDRPGGGGLWKWVIGLVALAVVGAGGYVAYDQFLKSDGDSVASAQVDAAPDSVAAVDRTVDAGPPVDADTTPDASALAPPVGGELVIETTPDDKLVIRSKPSRGRVYLDGSVQGKTPLTLDATSDHHRLAIILPGYRLFTADIAGSGSAEATLEEVTPSGGEGGIKVRCRDKNRYYVFVNGHDTGQLCPTERIGVDLGEHVVEIYDPESDSRQEFRVTVDQTRFSTRIRVD